MVKPTLLAYRSWSGLGDWIMAMTVLKMVNQQFPNIDIYLNLVARNKFKNMLPDYLPSVVEEVARGFDVKIEDYVYYIIPERAASEYTYNSGHMTYSKDGKDFIENMVAKFRFDSGIELEYDPNTYAQYIKGDKYDNTFDQFKPYVLLQSCSKRRCEKREGKDFGFSNMEKITNRLLNSNINVIQIGQNTDYVIPNIPSFLSVNLDTLHKLMVNSEGFIGMDGGLGVYASHHNVPQYIIYENKSMFSWTDFPHRNQLDGDEGHIRISNYIIDNLKETYEKSIRKNNLQTS